MSLLFSPEHSSVFSHLFVTDIFKECRPLLLEMSLIWVCLTSFWLDSGYPLAAATQVLSASHQGVMHLTFTADVDLYHLSKVVSWFLHCKLWIFFFLFKLEVSCEETIWGNINILFLVRF